MNVKTKFKKNHSFLGTITRGFLYLFWGIGLFTQAIPILLYVFFPKEYRYGNLLDNINTLMR